MMNLWFIVVMGVIVHLILLQAVFDIYFVSPINHGMQPHNPDGIAPAKRLVLIVADGLRSDSLYGPQMKGRAPYLHSIVHKIGSWGVSHTQVPTESRPGHVAILAGFYEDPSAITSGWKANPVHFDSVINQSSNAWCWGSPDIVNLFNRDNLSRIHLSSYDAEMQDFSGIEESTTWLDKWVFEQVNEFFKDQRNCTSCEVRESGNVFFLHLLGLDTAGHSFKPETSEYIDNLKVVDEGVQAAVELFENYFEDEQTAYIFTADHGMTDWGSHGDGSAHETEVPFIAWGAGIKRNAIKQDVKQADIAPLMSSLIGINIPINSIGLVPLNYVNVSEAQAAHIIHANALQLSEQYYIKQVTSHMRSFKWTFKPFYKLPKALLSEKREYLSYLARKGKYTELMRESYNLFNMCQEGLQYYITYHQVPLLIVVTVGFVGWILYLFISIKDLGTKTYETAERRMLKKISQYKYTYVLRLAWFVVFVIIIVLFMFVSNMPANYFLYCALPVFTWAAVVQSYKQGLITLDVLGSFSWLELLFRFSYYIIGIELLIATFFDRKYLSLVMLQIFSELVFQQKLRHKMEQFKVFCVEIIILALCPVLFQMQTQFSLLSLVFSWLLWFGFQWNFRFTVTSKDLRVLEYQFIVLRLAFVNNVIVQLTMSYGLGVFYISHMISWFLTILAFIFPILVSDYMQNRVVSAIIALVTPYTLMAIGHEHMFMFCLSQLMLSWVTAEYIMKYDDSHLPIYQTTTVFNSYYTDKDTVRRCFYLLTFIMLGYFGVGNTASLNSFDPLWVRSFVTVFSPFTMAFLILLKIIVPFLIVLCAFRGIMLVTKAQVRNTFLIILMFCDIMVIQFLYFVKNEGSWLEIGVSLSRFIAVNVTTIVLMVLYQIAYFLTTIPVSVFVVYLPAQLVESMQQLGILD